MGTNLPQSKCDLSKKELTCFCNLFDLQFSSFIRYTILIGVRELKQTTTATAMERRQTTVLISRNIAVHVRLTSETRCAGDGKVRESRTSCVGLGQRSRFLVLTKRSAASGDENASRRVESVGLSILMFCLYKKSFIAADISSNLCGITGAKVWDRLFKGFPSLH